MIWKVDGEILFFLLQETELTLQLLRFDFNSSVYLNVLRMKTTVATLRLPFVGANWITFFICNNDG
jgi:hypothetical protein